MGFLTIDMVQLCVKFEIPSEFKERGELLAPASMHCKFPTRTPPKPIQYKVHDGDESML